MSHKMLGMPRAPLEIATKSRKGMWQVHNCKTKSSESKNKRDDLTTLNLKPTFHKRKPKAKKNKTKTADTEEYDEMAEHQDIIDYISGTWLEFSGENKGETTSEDSPNENEETLKANSPSNIDHKNSPASKMNLYGQTPRVSSPLQPIAIYCDPPNDALNDFKPFDLDAWCSERLFMKITNEN